MQNVRNAATYLLHFQKKPSHKHALKRRYGSRVSTDENTVAKLRDVPRYCRPTQTVLKPHFKPWSFSRIVPMHAEGNALRDTRKSFASPRSIVAKSWLIRQQTHYVDTNERHAEVQRALLQWLRQTTRLKPRDLWIMDLHSCANEHRCPLVWCKRSAMTLVERHE